MTDVNQVIEIDPQFARAYFHRGKIYSKLENITQSKQDLEKAAELFLQQGDSRMHQEAKRMLRQL